jgi:bifunctional DNA-binding transcriptional regulator/antitoxin component of YhaV-PrlF toxin-antitoxin module
MQAQNQPQETWIKVLSKGVITIPKEFRDQLGLEEGDVAKAKIEEYLQNNILSESRCGNAYRKISN